MTHSNDMHAAVSGASCPGLDQIEDWLADRLDAASGARVAAHLESCRACTDHAALVRDNMRLAARVLAVAPQAATQALTDGSARQAEVDGASVGALPHDFLPGYTLVREISRGGQGVVYQAVQLSTRRRVAIKVLRDGRLADRHERMRFEREVRILGQLQHPNIVTIHDSGAVSGHSYYVMDYISGAPLDQHVARERLGAPQVLRLFLRVCDAVQAAHLRGVIHRDLKPSNIRVDSAGEPHVLDFGLAKVFGGADEAHATVTMTGQFLGSLPWSSPEQAAGQPDRIDVRSDVYALGVMLYQLLSGRFPYEVDAPLRDVLDRIVQQPPASLRRSSRGAGSSAIQLGAPAPSLRDVPAGPSVLRGVGRIDADLETIVFKALAKTRERRYQSVGEFARDIELFLSGQPILARRDSNAYMLRKLFQRNAAGASIAAAMFVALACSTGVTAWMWQRADQAERRERAQREQAQRDAAEADAVAGFMASLLRGQDLLQQNPDATVRDLLAHAGGQVDQAFPDAPHLQARVRTAIGLALRDLGLLEPAEREFRRALELRRQAPHGGAGAVLLAMNDLAVIRRDRGQFAEAEGLLRAVLAEIATTAPDVDQRFVCAVRDSLGVTLRRMGRLDEAAALLQEALAGREALAAASPEQQMPKEDLLESLTNLGALLVEQQQFRRAAEVLRDAASRQEQVLAADDPRKLDTWGNLAEALVGMGELRGADQAYQGALELGGATLPAEHPTVLRLQCLHGSTLRNLGRTQEAIELLRTSLAGHELTFGHSHAQTLVALHLLTEALLDAGELAEAKRVADEATQRAVHGEEGDPRIGWMGEANEAALYLASGETARAEQIARALLSKRLSALGEGHSHVLRSRELLGRILIAAGRPADALPALERASAGGSLGQAHFLALSARVRLAECLWGLGRIEDGRREAAKAIAGLEPVLGSTHPIVELARGLVTRQADGVERR